MPKLSSKEDRKNTRESSSRDNQGNLIKLEEGHNFIVLLEEDYEEGYTHWVKIKGKTYRRTCLGGLETKGWDPESCELCNLSLEMYDMKKAANLDGDKLLAKDYNERGNNIRSNYSGVFKAIKFPAIVERTKDKRGKSIKKHVPDYEEYEVGKIALTHAQVDKLFDLVEEDEPDFITEGSDVIMRVLDFHKGKEGDDVYARLKEIRPSKRKFDFKKLEEDFDEEAVPDISEEFALDEDLDKIADLYRAELEGGEEEEYEEEELEKKSSKGKKKKKSKPKGVKKAAKEEDEEEEDEDIDLEEDDFDDDEPF